VSQDSQDITAKCIPAGDYDPAQTRSNEARAAHAAKSTGLHNKAHHALGAFELYSPLSALLALLAFSIIVSLVHFLLPQYRELLLTLQILLVLSSFYAVFRMVRCVERRLLAPLGQLRDWAQRMRSGDLSARVVPPENAELAALSHDINSLGEALRALTREMDEQVHRQTITLQRKTRSLEILYDVAAHSNATKNLDELLITFLNTLTEIVYAHAGTVRLITDDNQMRLVGSVGLDEATVEKYRLVPIERCLCAQEFSRNMLVCPNHFEQCQNVIGETLFAGDKLENIAIPLRYQNRTLGIYNLFVEKLGLADRADIKDILTNIGQHLSMAIEKSHWDEESKRMSIMQERTMLAHELHDSLAQTLASLRFRVSMLQQNLQQEDNEAAGKEAKNLKTGLDEANFELRELLSHFRVRMDERGLIPATEDLIERFKNETDIQVFFQNECPDLKLPAMLEVHLLHIVQEALANIRKHSDAQNVRVMMHCSDHQQFHLLIEDDGMGIGSEVSASMPGEHVGLTIMRERASRIGAELSIESESGEGTRVELILPASDTAPDAIDTDEPTPLNRI